MKKAGLLLSVLAASTIVSATSYDYEFTPVIGGVMKEGNLNLENELPIVGAEFKFNDMFESSIKPELSVLLSPDVDYKGGLSGDTDIYRFMLNGVYEYENTGSNVIPFAKAGLGYEYMNERYYDNVSSPFADAGVGVKLPLSEQIALKLEAIYMIKRNDNRWDNNLAGLVGLTFAFGGKEAAAVAATTAAVAAVPADSDNDGVADADDQCPNTPVGATVDAAGCALDSDADGVADYLDKCPDTPAGVKVDENGCPIDSDGDGVADYLDKCPDTPEGVKVDAAGCALDSDGDGVADYMDKCPDTPVGFRVDAEGCPLSMSLTMTYALNSAKIDAASSEKVLKFAKFLNENPGYKVQIIGYTDSAGKADYNQKLSEARANSLRTMLIENGVDASRLRAEGRGESNPIADNKSKEGRAANRRIEVILNR